MISHTVAMHNGKEHLPDLRNIATNYRDFARGPLYLKQEKNKGIHFRPTFIYVCSLSTKGIDQIHGCSYEETCTIQEPIPYQACYPIFKSVQSTATNVTYNMGSK
ncbi:hypothetical protein RJ639_040935 [Escallonia herrerae]|uniref:Uncharacterized protein n=1 Tax=Escallonia herrerae TaxID=1293975 RepID=A0AA88WDX9_9ASTE|nr:hypothetical protein RJ639_040935 [Escallonia herrerae]